MKEKDLYNSFNSIKTNDEQKSKMLDHILNPNNDFKTVKNRKPKLVLAIVLVCIMTSTVIAINIPAFQELLEKISPNVAEFIEPVEEVCINKGIKMEVVATARYDNMVKAYVTFEDLEANRIGKDLSFLDYYSIRGTNSSSFGSCGWTMIDYDEESKKATILVEVQNNRKFEGENLNFKVDNIFYDSKEYEDYHLGIDLTKINPNPSYSNVNTEQFMSWSNNELYSDEDLIPILEPHVEDIEFPEINTSMISNIGIIDGKLHVQIWRDKNFEGQDVSIYLKNPKGEKIYCDAELSFGIDKFKKPTRDSNYPSYDEYIFDIDINKLDEYQLLGYFNTRKQIEGPWQISFKAEEGKILEQSCNINLGDIKIEKISINPFAISLRGNGINGADFSKLNIEINTENGVIWNTKSNINWSGTHWSGNQSKDFISSYDIEEPINLELIKSITINGVEIIIK
ncbi:MAG: hypothetical protein GX968_00305 [Tissierellia bacterium]|nr:hypothetical protein [Tissierellia bacterium]